MCSGPLASDSVSRIGAWQMNQREIRKLDGDHIPTLVFFHGTSSPFARGLLGRPGGISFPRDECITACQELFALCMSHVDNIFLLGDLFIRGNSPMWSTAPIALQNVANGNDRSRISYGELYITMNPEIAVNYCCRSPYGSELLLVISETARVLRGIGDREIEWAMDKYPRLSRVLELPHRPVVLEISGVRLDQLVAEGGKDDKQDEPGLLSWIELNLNSFKEDGIRVPAAFRVTDLRPNNIRAIYPLTEPACEEVGPFQRRNLDLPSCRLTPSEWD
jgi:hypothetical protein